MGGPQGRPSHIPPALDGTSPRPLSACLVLSTDCPGCGWCPTPMCRPQGRPSRIPPVLDSISPQPPHSEHCYIVNMQMKIVDLELPSAHNPRIQDISVDCEGMHPHEEASTAWAPAA